MKFFILERPKLNESAAVTDFHPLNPVRGDAPHCPLCGGYTGMLPLLPPVRVEVEAWGTEFGDLAFGPGEELLVSDHFWKHYGTSSLVGLSFVGSAEVAKVKSRKKFQTQTPYYYCCRVGNSKAAV